ncbi:MAG: hypothetical protein ACKVHH_05685 [Candidatus Poseidoniales archaeon]|jgi:uncharacterized membrane protein YdjX (TVP38/TMEM64 family)
MELIGILYCLGDITYRTWTIGLFGTLVGTFLSYFLASALPAKFSTWVFHLPLLVNL